MLVYANMLLLPGTRSRAGYAFPLRAVVGPYKQRKAERQYRYGKRPGKGLCAILEARKGKEKRQGPPEKDIRERIHIEYRLSQKTIDIGFPIVLYWVWYRVTHTARACLLRTLGKSQTVAGK